MRRSTLLTASVVVLALVLAASSPAQALGRDARSEKAETCGLKGTWYGLNNHGDDLAATYTRTGRGVYAVNIDYPASLVPGTTAGSSWKGELVKVGAKKYQLTVMSFFRLEEGIGLPMAMGHCSITSKKLGCDLMQGKGTCSFFGFVHGQDPFTEGIPLSEPTPIKNLFRRMPTGAE